jgi:hypothetical protein
MSQAPAMCSNPCETCAKEGLPLLLTRYALLPSETRAPRLSGNLDAEELKQVALGSTEHYGLRLLRSGYVYVFDEKRNHWSEYFVTTNGFLSKMPPRIRALKVQPRPATEFQCANKGAAPMASVITIRNPLHAGKVWIAFSDVEWTDAVFAEHLKQDHRAKHMKCVTITGGKVASQPGTAPLEQLQKLVPEYILPAAQALASFANWCPHMYNSREGAASALLNAANAVRPGGGAAIVSLHDPVGLATEIAALMEARKTIFINHDAVVKPRFAASSIASLEAGIKEQAKAAEVQAGEELAQLAEQGPASYNPNAALAGVAGDLEAADRWRNITPQQLEKVADNAWKKYTHDRTGKPRFNGAASEAWLSTYNEGFKKFDTEKIAPLAKAHAAWLQHACMVNHMSCNYDRQDLASGAAYTAGVAAMLRHTSDKQASYDLYCKWLQEGETDAAKNLIMRALAFNQDRLLEEIKKADDAPLDKRAFPTDMVVDFFKDGLAKLPPGGHSAMADLLQSVGGALFRNMDQAINDAGAARRALAAVAAVAGVQFTSLEVTGTRGKFVQHLMQALMQLDPNMKVSANELGKAVATQVRLMEIEGLPVKQPDKRKWLIVLDKAAAQRAGASGKTGAALAAELAKTGLRGVQDLPSLKASAFKAGVAGDAFDAGGTFVVGLVQSFNIVKLVNDYRDQMKHEGAEPLQRLVTAAFAVLGSFGEATGLVLKRAQDAGRLMNAPGRFTTAIPKALIAAGKLLGLGTGVVVAGLDWMKADEAQSKGDVGLARAYRSVAFLGGGLAVAFYVSHLLGPIGWLIVGIAVIALLVVTLWIEKNKDNKIQEWLMRCHFGTLSDKYKDYEEESKELKLAFA